MPAFVGFAGSPARQAEVATAVVMVTAGGLLSLMVAIVNLTVAAFAILGSAIGILAGWLGGTVESHSLGTALRTRGRAERSWRDPHPILGLIPIVLLLAVAVLVLLANVLPQSPLPAGLVVTLSVALAMDAGGTAALIARGLHEFEVESGREVWVRRIGVRWVYSLDSPAGPVAAKYK